MKRIGYLELLVTAAIAAAVFPAFALAQVSAPTFHGFDLTPVISALIGLVGILLTWVARKVAATQASSAEQSRAETALLRVSALAVALAGRAWDRLGPEMQKILADGAISAAERTELESIVKELVADFTSADDLKALADALGLPLPGLIAKLASMLIDTFTKAHDPGNTEVSAGAFPVSGTPAFSDAG